MQRHIQKKLFSHGGSKAIDLPMDFVRQLQSEHVNVEISDEGLFIPLKQPLDRLESDPLFEAFIEGIMKHALSHPDQLQSAHEVWDSEWDDLLEGVDGDEE